MGGLVVARVTVAPWRELFTTVDDSDEVDEDDLIWSVAAAAAKGATGAEEAGCTTVEEAAEAADVEEEEGSNVKVEVGGDENDCPSSIELPRSKLSCGTKSTVGCFCNCSVFW